MASKEENIEKLRQRTLKVWQDENYRKRQSEVHKEWVKNNPDKIRCYNSSHGKVFSNKANKELYYDSSWEKEVIINADSIDEITKIDRSNLIIEYEFEGSIRRYFPDFRIEIVSSWPSCCLYLLILRNIAISSCPFYKRYFSFFKIA